MELNDKSILITGGTGSFGKAIISYLLDSSECPKRIIIFSRDELKQWELQKVYPEEKYPQLRFFLGDIRDKDRLNLAFRDVDIVIHAAALKQVPTAEYNPMEFIKTNVIGADNIINASIENKVKKIVALSTDKAAAPVNLYGATKLCSDKLFVAANNIVGDQDIAFSVVRYGNVMGSRGSVIPFFIKEAKNVIIPVTDRKMTRFNITLESSIEMVIWSIKNCIGGEIIVPKLDSYRIMDIVKAIAPTCKVKFIGTREGEKTNEEMITSSDSATGFSIGRYYILCSTTNQLKKLFPYYKNTYKDNCVLLEKDFSYNSANNHEFISVEKLRDLIKVHIDYKFTPV